MPDAVHALSIARPIWIGVAMARKKSKRGDPESSDLCIDKRDIKSFLQLAKELQHETLTLGRFAETIIKTLGLL